MLKRFCDCADKTVALNVKGINMNQDKRLIQDAIETRLLERFRALQINPLSKKGAIEEAAFLAGAGSALQAVFETDPTKLTDYVPPMWIIGPMSGRSVVVEIAKERAQALVKESAPLKALRHHVTGAIERGEKEPIVGIPAKVSE